MVVLFLFAFTAFATSDKLGSPGAVWEALTEVRWLLRAMKVPLLSLTSVLSSLGWKASSCRRQCWRQLSDYEIPRRGYLLLVLMLCTFTRSYVETANCWPGSTSRRTLPQSSWITATGTRPLPRPQLTLCQVMSREVLPGSRFHGSQPPQWVWRSWGNTLRLPEAAF